MSNQPPKKKRNKEPRAVKHGTIGAYTNRGCRCEPCTVAHREYQREYLANSPKQRRLATLRERIRYWTREVELREYRNADGKLDGNAGVAEARRQLRNYTEMFAETKAASDIVEPVS